MKKSIFMLVAAFCFLASVSANAEEGPYEKLGRVCGEQIEKLCPKIVIGQGRVLACLEKNKDQISEECNSARIDAQKQFDAQASSN